MPIQDLEKNPNKFDPQAILGVSKEDAENEDFKKDLRKKWKKLSLKYHPDKNDEPGAEATFKTIQSAYNTLTDPETFENWQKYGNPEGSRYMKFGLAMPLFLVESKKAKALTILFFFITACCLIPLVAFYILCKKSVNHYDLISEDQYLIGEIFKYLDNKKMVSLWTQMQDFDDMFTMNKERVKWLTECKKILQRNDLEFFLELQSHLKQYPQKMQLVQYVMCLLVCYLQRVKIPQEQFVLRDQKRVLEKILKFNVMVCEELLKNEAQTQKYLSMSPPAAVKHMLQEIRWGVKPLEKVLEMNQRLVQGIGINQCILDQFHTQGESLKDKLQIGNEDELLTLKKKDKADFMSLLKVPSQLADSLHTQVQNYPEQEITLTPKFNDMKCEYFSETEKFCIISTVYDIKVCIQLNTKNEDYFHSQLPFEKHEKLQVYLLDMFGNNEIIKAYNTILMNESVVDDKVELTIKDIVDDKLLVNKSKGNKSLNECLEEWHADITQDFKLYHAARKSKSQSDMDVFKKKRKYMDLIDLKVKFVNDCYLNKKYTKDIQIVKPRLMMFEGINSAYLQVLLDEINYLYNEEYA